LKNIDRLTFYFVEERSEDIMKEYNVNCFDLLFFSVFMVGVMGGKITVSLKELH